jgi:transposase
MKPKLIQTEVNEFLPRGPKPTYPQVWSAYNKAQTNEKLLFMHLLRDLCEFVEETKLKGKGRPSLSVNEMLFCTGLATYVGKSSRRLISDLAIAEEMKYISKKPHFNSVINYLNKPDLTPVLHNLITLSALPLKQFEEHFGVDSSGFSTSMYAHWFEHKWKGDKQKRLWRKAHVMSGVKTNVITKVEITTSKVNDSIMFKPLVEHTAKYFNMQEVSADKAYSSKANLKVVHDYRAIPFIPFKKNVSGRARGSFIWAKMYRLFKKHNEEFMKRYHLRSNAETVFAMLKRKFSPKLRCKNEVGQDNEILLMCLCHNICVLIQEFFELGIKIDFNYCAKELFAQKITF